LFPKTLSEKEWGKADARFLRKGAHTEWILSKKMPASWNVEIGTLRMQVKPTSFKHVGLFPEQVSNWNWLTDTIKKSKRKQVKVLNLFGYTGGASLACTQAGAEVTHIDGSKSTYTWAKKNQELSGLSEVKIKFLIDDSISFLKRELKRGNVYDGIIMDPPSFGHGPNGELWKIEESLVALFESAFKVLSLEPLFFLVNGYSSGYSVTTYKNNLFPLVKRYGGKIETGELVIPCTSNPDKKLPAGIVARWST
jgi:23S rRNA (cytosine1962-C5)-methyltransferase